MKLLLVGGGGREHAIAWKLGQSTQVSAIFVAPGNGGTASMAKVENVAIDASDLPALQQFAQEKQIDLTVVGPEAPLVAGLADAFHAIGLRVFGPSRAAARLEGSKAFSKAFMQRHGIPTGQAEIFDDYEAAVAYVQTLEAPPVIKASGLAAGKGVLLPESREGAVDVLHQMLVERRFGTASATVLVEERLTGPEMSVLAFSDGETLRVMPVAQDHKRLLDDDQGPNTGGMGAFVPSPLATPELLAQVERQILRPALDGIAAEGAPYVGVLYAGLMLTDAGPKVLEFNCRFGDPETQVILPLMASDLAEVMLACVEGRLAQTALTWKNEAAVAVVMASAGYPGSYETGKPIRGLDAAEALGCSLFHAGTRRQDGQFLTDGGRVLAVTALGPDLPQAAEKAYAGVDCVHFEGAIHRHDIGRETQPQ